MKLKLYKKINFRCFFYISFLSFINVCCYEEPPELKDGFCSFELKILFKEERENRFLPADKAKIIMKSTYEIKIFYADDSGFVKIKSLPTSYYSFVAFYESAAYPNVKFSGLKENIFISDRKIHKDTIICLKTADVSICINELYVSGPINNIYYFYDQFIELYNSSDEIKYLDGIIVARLSGNREGKGPGADEHNDGDIDGVTFIYKFPGRPGEKNYPFMPKKFLVLASDAVDHTKYVASSVDLSKADWEFYNQFSPEDIDNPLVPNLINLRSDTQADFLMNLLSDVIILANGRDSVWQDGIDLSTIIDGVQYLNNLTSIKTLDIRIDKGFILSPPRYSGKSMQRILPGYDTDNATIDWEIISKPTPGFFK